MIVPISRNKEIEQYWADRENAQEISLKVIAWQEQQGQEGQNASMWGVRLLLPPQRHPRLEGEALGKRVWVAQDGMQVRRKESKSEYFQRYNNVISSLPPTSSLPPGSGPESTTSTGSVTSETEEWQVVMMMRMMVAMVTMMVQMPTSEPGEWRVLTCSIIAWLWHLTQQMGFEQPTFRVLPHRRNTSSELSPYFDLALFLFYLFEMYWSNFCSQAKYERLVDAHKRLQRNNICLEEKLLKVAKPESKSKQWCSKE